MKQLKKTLLTLALLSMTAGAWADGTLLTTITASADFQSGSKTFDNIATVTLDGNFYGTSDWAGNGTIKVTPVAGVTITSVKFFSNSSNIEDTAAPFQAVQAYDSNVSHEIYDVDGVKGHYAVIKIEVYGTAPTGPEVAWDKDKKTGTFKMPGGNVTLEPEYYPQAALTAAPTAINDVPATTDGAIVNAGTVANIGETTTAQGTVMYYVSQTALDDDALLALAADQWTADVPTAESLAQGQAYVYYYVRGNDSDTDEENFSDGDILAANALTVTIAAEPTYAVTFAEGTEESDKWSASPNADVKKGQQVTVTYTGSKKIIGVKAEKKAATTSTQLSAVTTSDIGKVVCAEGHLHDAKTAVPDGCTAVGILGKVTETGHGLILALEDATSQDWNTINGWTSETTYAGTTLKVLPDDAARGTNLTSYTTLGTTAVSNWAVAQKSDYEAIFINLGSTTGDSDGTTYDFNVNDYINTGVGGTAISGDYWSATESGVGYAWRFDSEYWSSSDKTNSRSVRPVLGF